MSEEHRFQKIGPFLTEKIMKRLADRDLYALIQSDQYLSQVAEKELSKRKQAKQIGSMGYQRVYPVSSVGKKSIQKGIQMLKEMKIDPETLVYNYIKNDVLPLDLVIDLVKVKESLIYSLIKWIDEEDFSKEEWDKFFDVLDFMIAKVPRFDKEFLMMDLESTVRLHNLSGKGSKYVNQKIKEWLMNQK